MNEGLSCPAVTCPLLLLMVFNKGQAAPRGQNLLPAHHCFIIPQRCPHAEGGDDGGSGCKVWGPPHLLLSSPPWEENSVWLAAGSQLEENRWTTAAALQFEYQHFRF